MERPAVQRRLPDLRVPRMLPIARWVVPSSAFVVMLFVLVPLLPPGKFSSFLIAVMPLAFALLFWVVVRVRTWRSYEAALRNLCPMPLLSLGARQRRRLP